MSVGDFDPGIRVGRNQGGYRGERIDVDRLIGEASELALSSGWTLDPLAFKDGRSLPAFVRRYPSASSNIYLSAGIHGDEPAGPLAMRQLLGENQWPDRFNYWAVPCLNPVGFARNTRENEDGLDLNRDYHLGRAPAVEAHINWLGRQPNFDLALILHEDWESNGFYIYELNPDSRPSLADRMTQAVSRVCPLDLAAQIEGREAVKGMIRFVGSMPERAEWPEAFYLAHHNVRHNYTLEAPSDFAMSVRVRALVTAVRAALDGFDLKI